MAGTTSNYLFPYPTNTDLVRNGASAIQSLADSIDSFIQGSEGSGKLFDILADNVVTTSTSGLTSTSYTNIPTNPNSISTTVGKSGLVVLIVQVRGLVGSSAHTMLVSPNITGSSTVAASDNSCAGIASTSNSTACWIGIYDITSAGTFTSNLQYRVSSTASGTIVTSRQTLLALG